MGNGASQQVFVRPSQVNSGEPMTPVQVPRDERAAAMEPFAVSLSGGGTRAAATASGMLCYLNARGLLCKIAELSSVSGGGYTASSYVLWRKENVSHPPEAGVPEAWFEDYLLWMSRNSGYCCAWNLGVLRGIVDSLRMVAVLLIALIVSSLTIAPVSILMCFAISYLFGSFIVHNWEPTIITAACVFAGTPILFALIDMALSGVMAQQHLQKARYLMRAMLFIVSNLSLTTGFAAIPIFSNLLTIIIVCIVVTLLANALQSWLGAKFGALFGAGISFIAINVLQSRLVVYMCGAPIVIATTVAPLTAEGSRLMVLVSGVVYGLTYIHCAGIRGKLWGLFNQSRLRGAFYPRDQKTGQVIDPPFRDLAIAEEQQRIPKLNMGVTSLNWGRQSTLNRTTNDWDWDASGSEFPVAATSKGWERFDSCSRQWTDASSKSPAVLHFEDESESSSPTVSQVMGTSAAALAAEVKDGSDSIMTAVRVATGSTMSWWQQLQGHPDSPVVAVVAAGVLFLLLSIPSVLVWLLEVDGLILIPFVVWILGLMAISVVPDEALGVYFGNLGPVMNIRVLLDISVWTDTFPKVILFTDGGRLENIGLLPLLKARHKRILSVDAGFDPNRSIPSFLNLIKLARAYLDCYILPPADAPERDIVEYLRRVLPTMDVVQLRTQFALLPGQTQHEEGVLLFMKSLMSTWTPPAEDVAWEQSLAATHPHIASMHLTVKDREPRVLGGCCCECCHNPLVSGILSKVLGGFPNMSTGIPWFTESQFNAYHRIGFLLACKAGRLLEASSRQQDSSAV